MKKRVSIIPFVILFAAGPVISAQDCKIFEDFKAGTTTKMVHYDKKDKVTGSTTTTIKEKKSLANGVSIAVSQLYDNNDDYTFENEFSLECRDGVTYVDMEKFVDPNQMAAYEDMEIEVTADDLTIPASAMPGDELNTGSVVVRVNTGTPVNVTISVDVTDRKVESVESIETPAGKFDCLKIAYNMMTKVGFVKIETAAIEYYNSEVGVVKSESYNKRGKLTGYTVLEEINK